MIPVKKTPPLGIPPLCDRQIEREVLARFPAPLDLTSNPDNPAFARAVICAEVAIVRASMLLRHQNGYVLAQQLFGMISKYDLR
jgi:hypothetical protein